MKKSSFKKVAYYNDFRHLITNISELYENKTAITFYTRNKKIDEHKYKQLAEDSISFAKGLAAAGINGKNTAIISENSYLWVASFFGIVSAGGVAVPIDTENTGNIIHDLIKKSDCEVILISEEMLGVLDEMSEILDKNIKIIVLGYRDEHQTFDNICAEGKDTNIDSIKIEPDQTAAIIFTSGTTAVMKPVMLTHKSILYNASDVLSMIDTQNKVFNTLPFYHSYGLTCGLIAPLINGCNIAICSDVRRIIRDVELFKPYFIISVPLIVEVIYSKLLSIIDSSEHAGEIHKYLNSNFAKNFFNNKTKKQLKNILIGTAFENLKNISTGGAYMSETISKKLEKMDIIVLNGYGVTECSPVVSCNRNNNYEFKSTGEVLPGYKVKIVDDEILIKGVSLMKGYYKEEALTSASFEDGWFKTGDLGYLKNNKLYIRGRKKNLIVMKNGKKVSAEELESVIKTIPLVKEVMAYGATTGISTDDVKIAATIYPDPEQITGMTSYEILAKLQKEVDRLNNTLPAYQQIQMINLKEEDFGRTSNFKIKRQTN
ncbi:AMP-binding protein [Eubacteriales bacterium OttesenSCG-928-G02]|nr:AMP-binding protein [Eubacteriales bacterium OttesenSCG-928-G02]